MKHAPGILATIGLGLLTAPALAQVGGMSPGGLPGGGLPPGGMTEMTEEQVDALTDRMMRQMGARMGLDAEALQDATPEERERMLQRGAMAMTERLMLRIGASMGLDPEALRDATPEERTRMLQDGAAAMANRTTKQVEQTLGIPIQEMKTLSDEEVRARMAARAELGTARAPISPRPLPTAPRQGFPDGSVPLPVGDDYSAELVFEESPVRELLIVAADLRARQIVWRESRTMPLREHLDLLELAQDPAMLVLELIDPRTRRVIRRYRPVAAATE